MSIQAPAPALPQQLPLVPDNFIFKVLPTEVHPYYLHYLDPPSIEMLRMTCKTWKNLTHDHVALKARFCGAAALFGYKNLIIWARARGAPWQHIPLSSSSDSYNTCEKAALGGHLELLKWAALQGAPDDEGRCASAAIQGGHWEIFHYLHTQYHFRTGNVVFCNTAAKHGQLEILQHLRKLGFSWGKEGLDGEVCQLAAKHGHRRLLEWAMANGASYDASITTHAAEGGSLEVLQWLYANHKDLWGSDVAEVASGSGNVELLKWLHTLPAADRTFNDSCMTYAAGNGKLAALQYLHSLGIAWTNKVCESALYSNQPEVLHWAMKNGAPFGETLSLTTLNSPHLPLAVLSVAMANGATLHPSITLNSFKLCVPLVRWAYANKPEWITSELYCEAAKAAHHQDVLDYLHSIGIPWDDRFITYIRDPKTLQWAITHNVPLPDDLYLTYARTGGIALIQCLAKNGVPIDEKLVMKEFPRWRREEMQEWFQKRKRGKK